MRFTWPKSRCWRGCVPATGSKGKSMFCSILFCFVLFCFVSQLLEVLAFLGSWLLPPSSKLTCIVKSLSLPCPTLWLSHFQFHYHISSPQTWTLLPFSYKDLRSWLHWAYWDNPGPSPHLHILYLLISVESLLPWKVPRIRMSTYLTRGEEEGITQPATAVIILLGLSLTLPQEHRSRNLGSRC